MVALLAARIVWGSCSTTFMEVGNYKRAMDFVRRDLSSEWSKAHAVEVLLREGKTQEAIQIGPPRIPHWDSYKILLTCAPPQPQSQSNNLPAGLQIAHNP